MSGVICLKIIDMKYFGMKYPQFTVHKPDHRKPKQYHIISAMSSSFAVCVLQVASYPCFSMFHTWEGLGTRL